MPRRSSTTKEQAALARQHRAVGPGRFEHWALDGLRDDGRFPSDAPPGAARSTSRAREGLTWRSLAEALEALLAHCASSPAPCRLRDQAGAPVRLRCPHYDDVEAIYRTAFECLSHLRADQLPQISPKLALSDRVRQTVAQRAQLFEAIAPLRRAAARAPARRTSMAKAARSGDDRLRARLEHTFGLELAAARRARGDRLTAMELVTSYEAWDRLRRIQGLSIRAAGRAMSTCLLALVEQETRQP